MKRTTKRRSGTTRKRSSTTQKAAPRTPEHPAPSKGERAFILDVPFEERAVARHFGARYFSSEGWAYVGTSLPSDLERYRPKKYSWQEWQERTLLGEISATTPAPDPDPTTGALTLRKDQLQDVKKVLLARQAGAPEVLNASDVGVGKTLVAISAIKRMAQVKNVLVICPLTVAAGWRLHLRDMGDGGMNWCIINYESTKKLLEPPASAKNAKKTRTKNMQTVQRGKPKVQWDVVVVDEAHYCANPESQRTRAIDKIVAGPAHSPAFKLNMSATAGKDPSRVSYLHRSLFWVDGLKPLPQITADRFVEWCEAHRLSVGNNSFGNALKWDPEANGSNPDRELERLHRLLFEADPVWAFRRRPDWPEQRRIPVPVELTWDEMEAYNADWKEFQQALAAIDRKIKSTSSGKTKSALRAKGLAEQTRYRQKAGQVRASGTAAFVAEMLEKGYQVAVSAEYLGTVNRVQEELERLNISPALFTGENRETRESERIAYQRGEKQVILYTPTEGFNLHAGDTSVGGNDVPRVTVVAEPRWSPIKAFQSEGRGQRNGTNAPVYYVFASGTVEETVIKRCIDGMENIGKINGDDTKPFEGLKEALGVPVVFAA